jgi:ketosteroid isomerase-like protein
LARRHSSAASLRPLFVVGHRGAARLEAENGAAPADRGRKVKPDPREEIEEIVNRETRAWDAQDADLLLTVFHPDMVWPWPPDTAAHDPVRWVMPFGRFDAARWRRNWEELFRTHDLVRNKRTIVRIEVSEEKDGAFAVVDVDTLWRDGEGNDFHWFGRACKIYTKVPAGWKMTCQVGLLTYPRT